MKVGRIAVAVDGMMGVVSEQHWPLFGLRVRTPRLELRYPTDDDYYAVVALAAEGIHDSDTMPFYVPWTRAASPLLERNMLQYYWSQRGALSPARWSLPLVVFEHGRQVRIQDVMAEQFAVTRTVETGSSARPARPGPWPRHRDAGRGAPPRVRGTRGDRGVQRVVRGQPHVGHGQPGQRVRAQRFGALRRREGAPARSLKWILTRDRRSPAA